MSEHDAENTIRTIMYAEGINIQKIRGSNTLIGEVKNHDGIVFEIAMQEQAVAIDVFYRITSVFPIELFREHIKDINSKADVKEARMKIGIFKQADLKKVRYQSKQMKYDRALSEDLQSFLYVFFHNQPNDLVAFLENAR